MRDASNLLYQCMESGEARFYQTAVINFTNGTSKNLTAKDFYIGGQSFSDSAGTQEFPLGEAICSTVTLNLVNDDGRYDKDDFYHARIAVYCNCDLPNGTTERFMFGTFTVVEPEAYGDTVNISAVNDMYKGNIDYSTNLEYPLTVIEALQDSCLTCGVNLITGRFANSDYVIKEKPENITHRQLWGYCAMLAGGNAVMDEYNRLSIKTISFYMDVFDGGRFDEDTPYYTGSVLDGGDFTWNLGDVADGGTFTDSLGTNIFNYEMDITPSTDDITITGITTTVDNVEYSAGVEGYMLKISNPLIEKNPQDAVTRIASILIGGMFRPVEIKYTPYPLAQFGDSFVVRDRKGNYYKGIVTDMEFTFDGATTIKCSAKSPLRNSGKYLNSSAQAIIQAKHNTDTAISNYDIAMQTLTALMAQSFGTFKTAEVQEDGSVIYYIHNKPELINSQTRWKMTADGLAVSTDYGVTWNAGIDSQGNAVVNILSAIGINFDWANGGTITLGGQNNINGKITVKDASGVVKGTWDKDGIIVKSGTIEGSTLKGNTISAGGNNNQDGTITVKDASGNITGAWNKDGIIVKSGKIEGAEIIANNGFYYPSKDAPIFRLDNNNFSIVHGDGAIAFVDGQLSASYKGSNNVGFYLADGVDSRGKYVGIFPRLAIGEGDGTDPYKGLIYCNNIITTYPKSRTSKTQNYGERLTYCYEMASPIHGDIGSGITDNNGECFIAIDDIFSETIKERYDVFLQKYGDGDLWVSERQANYFIVKGTPNLSFAWEIKSKQYDSASERLEVLDNFYIPSDLDYISELQSLFEQFIEEQEAL